MWQLESIRRNLMVRTAGRDREGPEAKDSSDLQKLLGQ